MSEKKTKKKTVTTQKVTPSAPREVKQTNKQTVNVCYCKGSSKCTSKKKKKNTSKSQSLGRSAEQLQRIQQYAQPFIVQSLPTTNNDLLNEIKKIQNNYNNLLGNNPIPKNIVPIDSSINEVKKNIVSNANNITEDLSIIPRADDFETTSFYQPITSNNNAMIFRAPPVRRTPSTQTSLLGDNWTRNSISLPDTSFNRSNYGSRDPSISIDGRRPPSRTNTLSSLYGPTPESTFKTIKSFSNIPSNNSSMRGHVSQSYSVSIDGRRPPSQNSSVKSVKSYDYSNKNQRKNIDNKQNKQNIQNIQDKFSKKVEVKNRRNFPKKDPKNLTSASI